MELPSVAKSREAQSGNRALRVGDIATREKGKYLKEVQLTAWAQDNQRVHAEVWIEARVLHRERRRG